MLPLLDPKGYAAFQNQEGNHQEAEASNSLAIHLLSDSKELLQRQNDSIKMLLYDFRSEVCYSYLNSQEESTWKVAKILCSEKC